MTPHEVLALGELLGRLVDERVDQRLRELGVAVADVAGYSGSRLPPRTSRRAFFEACRRGKVEGAARDGRGWKCTRASWEAYRGRVAEGPARDDGARDLKPSNVVELDAMLAGAGMRRTR